MLYSPIYYQSISTKINNFTIIGERHSGTNWLENLILCRLDIPLTWEFGSKHFIETLDINKMANANDSLFICITRDIYDWIGGFFQKPHHVHDRLKNNLENFLLSEWDCGLLDKHFFHGLSYKNLFHLRSDKMFYYFYNLPYIVDNIVIIKYEDLMINPENIITFISNIFNIKKTMYKYSKITLPKHKPAYIFDKKNLEIIRDNTDWSIESLFNYYPR